MARRSRADTPAVCVNMIVNENVVSIESECSPQGG
jgi:hypothetical protein